MKQKKWNVTVVDNPNIATISESDDFYTTDTEAFLVFELKDKDFKPAAATITLHNRADGSVINEDVEVLNGIVKYEMRHEVIEHAGGWQAQLVYEQDKAGVPEKYTSKVVSFSVSGHLLDTKEPAIVVIKNWDNFVLSAENLIEEWEAFEMVRQSNEDERISSETERKSAESGRVTAETERVEAESTRQTQEGIRQDAEDSREEKFKEMQLTQDLDKQRSYKTTLEISNGKPRLKIEEVI